MKLTKTTLLMLYRVGLALAAAAEAALREQYGWTPRRSSGSGMVVLDDCNAVNRQT